MRAEVRRLHDARAAAGNDREAGVGQAPRYIDGGFVPAVTGTHARAAENRHGRSDVGQAFGGLDEL